MNGDAHHAAPVRLAARPALWVVDDHLGDADVEALLALFGDESFVTAAADEVVWDAAGFCAEIAAARHPLLDRVCRRVEALLGTRSALPPRVRFRYYRHEQSHPPHFDAYSEQGATLAVTVLMTLIAPQSGGETRFPDAEPAPVAVAPRRGRLVAWTNTLPGGAVDPASRHDAAPVAAGAKAVVLVFIYWPADAAHGELALQPAA